MALRIRKYLALEKLEIEKVIELEKADASEDEMDLLADQLKQREKTKDLRREVENADDTSEDSTEDDDRSDVESVGTHDRDTDSDDDESDDEDVGSSGPDRTDASKDRQKASGDDESTDEDSDTGVSTEAYQQLHIESTSHFLALEHRFIEESAVKLGFAQEGVVSAVAGSAYGVGKATLGFAYDKLLRGDEGDEYNGILVKLGRLGISYSKVGLKHLAKGVLYALGRTLNAIIKGGKHLVQHIYKRRQSYENFQKKITKLQELIKQIKSSDQINEVNDQDEYKERITIAMLKTGQQLDLSTSLQHLIQLNTVYSTKLPNYVGSSIGSLKGIIKHVMEHGQDIPAIKYIDKLPVQGMKAISTDSGLTEYRYQYDLPGDRYFGYRIPNTEHDDLDAIYGAYHSSKSFVNVDDRKAFKSIEHIRYLNVDQCQQYLNILEELCKLGIDLHDQFDEVAKFRRQLKPSLQTYVKFITSEQDHLTVKNSLAEFVSLKVHFLDSVIIGGSMHLDDLNTSVLTSSLEYIKASLERYVD